MKLGKEKAEIGGGKKTIRILTKQKKIKYKKIQGKGEIREKEITRTKKSSQKIKEQAYIKSFSTGRKNRTDLKK